MATPADHIDIRTDFSELDPEAYREDVKERFALSAHPTVRNAEKRIEEMKRGAREAFQEAIDLRAEAKAKEREAETAVAAGKDEKADSLYEEAADLEQKADRKEKIATAKTRTLQKWVRDRDAIEAIAPVRDGAKKLVESMDAPAQRKRDQVHQEAEAELRAAAQEEMQHLLGHLKGQFEPFLKAFQKAKKLDSTSATAAGFGRSLGTLSGTEVSAGGGAKQGLDEKLADVFTEYGVA